MRLLTRYHTPNTTIYTDYPTPQPGQLHTSSGLRKKASIDKLELGRGNIEIGTIIEKTDGSKHLNTPYYKYESPSGEIKTYSRVSKDQVYTSDNQLRRKSSMKNFEAAQKSTRVTDPETGASKFWLGPDGIDRPILGKSDQHEYMVLGERALHKKVFVTAPISTPETKVWHGLKEDSRGDLYKATRFHETGRRLGTYGQDPREFDLTGMKPTVRYHYPSLNTSQDVEAYFSSPDELNPTLVKKLDSQRVSTLRRINSYGEELFKSVNHNIT